MTFYLLKHSNKLSNCHTLVSRIIGVSNNRSNANSSATRERGNMNSSNISSISHSLAQSSESDSAYTSASNDFVYRNSSDKTEKMEKYIKNTKAAEYIFNSPLFDTLKVDNVYDLEEAKQPAAEEDKEEVKEEIKEPQSPQTPQLFANPLGSAAMSQESLLVTLTNLEFLKKLSKSSIIEVLFILSKLMFGAMKIQVQKRLQKVGIIWIANKLFCLLLKVMETMSPGQDMKTQILKLAINYLSRDSYNLESKLE